MSQKLNVLIFSIVFAAGVGAGYVLHGYLGKEVKSEILLPVKLEEKTKTVVEYVPKEKPTDEDINISIPKKKITVKVNDKKVEFEKTDGEEYVFEKNKLQFTQESEIKLNIEVPIIRKRSGIGIGYNNKNGPSYLIKFPIPKSKNIDGWAYKDNESYAVGIMFGF